MPKFAVILPAAGAGHRFGGPIKKPFIKLDGREVVLRSCELFCTRDDVVQTWLAVAPDDLEVVKEKYGASIGFMGAKLIAGGAERVDTVRLALAQVTPEAEYVAIHDAVRPFLTSAHVDAIFAAAVQHGAAILATPVTSTLKRVSKSHVLEDTVPRAGLWLAQTPQVFRRDLLEAAYARFASSGTDPRDITDDAQVVQLAGTPVHVLPGPAYNLKITSPEDLPLGEAILKSMPKKKARALGAFEEANW